MTEFNIGADMLAACAIFMSTEETRYYLNGVFVMPHADPETGRGVLMVATDGHRLACFFDEQGFAPRSAIIAANFKDKALKTTAKEQGRRRLTFDLPDRRGTPFPASVTLCDKGEPSEGMNVGFLSISEIDGTFPDFKKVIPVKAFGVTPEGSVGLNPRYMLDVRTAIDRADIKGTGQALRAEQAEPEGPVIVRASSLNEAVFVVMPARVPCTPTPPLWLAWLYDRERAEEAA